MGRGEKGARMRPTEVNFLGPHKTSRKHLNPCLKIGVHFFPWIRILPRDGEVSAGSARRATTERWPEFSTEKLGKQEAALSNKNMGSGLVICIDSDIVGGVRNCWEKYRVGEDGTGIEIRVCRGFVPCHLTR